eukprot:350033-Chlamydomonas_euryale.AAC.7
MGRAGALTCRFTHSSARGGAMHPQMNGLVNPSQSQSVGWHALVNECLPPHTWQGKDGHLAVTHMQESMNC